MSKPLSVSEVSNYISTVLKRDPFLANAHIEGEVSNFKKSNGHVYFSLKDEKSAIRCIVFRNMELSKNISIMDGQHIVVKGSIITYAGSSTYQILVKSYELSGDGDLYQKFEKLKRKLYEEGLFDEKYKRPLPQYPKKIGVVTSPTGAAIRDIITTLQRRYPICDILLYPAKVQGEKASADIVEGLLYLDEMDLDLIIFGRGGGSFEDLDAFNQEELVRTVFQLKTPNISAVGHEIDTTIVDFVSDKRAATPTAAAELASPNLKDIIHRFDEKIEMLQGRLANMIKEESQSLEYYLRELNYYSPLECVQRSYEELNRLKIELDRNMVRNHKSRIDTLNQTRDRFVRLKPDKMIERSGHDLDSLLAKMQTSVLHILNVENINLESMLMKLNLVNPQNILEKGYAKVMKKNRIIESINQINKNEEIEIYLKDGFASALVQDKEKFNE